MNWVAENHYAIIVHQEKLERARTSGRGLGLQHLREGLSTLWTKLAVREQADLRQRRSAGTAHPSPANARPLEAQ